VFMELRVRITCGYSGLEGEWEHKRTG
jgi:hypothetical protein